jgi:hypothetical protein
MPESGEEMMVQLGDFVGALRDQLLLARMSEDPEMPIEVGPVTVEFTLLTRREGEGKAGVKFWVVDASVGGTLTSESTQKVTIQLQPLQPGGKGRARVRDREKG